MGERRSNYTGAEHNELIKRTIEAAEKKEPVAVTPMMILQDIARIARCQVECGAQTQTMQNSSRQILRELGRHGGLCQLDLAKSTHLKPPTISVALQKMENDGLVTRIIDDADGRATRVYLTDKGNAINKEIANRIRDIDAAAIEGLSEEECAALAATLEKIRDNLKKMVENK